MAASITDTISIQLETVRPVLEKIFEQSDQIAGKVKKSTKAQQISRYLYRMPFVQYAGGNFSKFSANGSSLGTGTSLKTSNLVAGYFYSVLGYRLNQEQIDTSQNTSQAITNVMTYTLANAMEEAKVLDDIAFHQTGTGILTNGASSVVVTNPASMTFASATDFLGIARLREGMVVDVWDAAGANKRTYTAPLIITNIDYVSRIATFNQAISDLIATDIVAFQGMTAYGPTTLTSFSSAYPGTAPNTTAAGIGGDSFRHGFPYMTDPTSSNYFYGIQKSSISQLLPCRVNAQSNPIEWDHIQRLIAQIMRKRDGDMWRNLVGIAPFAQRAAVFNLGIAISNKLLTGNKLGQSLDLIPDNTGYSDVFDMAGIPCYISKRQDSAQIDFISFQKIERAQLFDTRYHDIGGKYLFEGRGSDGTVQAFVEFFIEQAYDFVCVDCGGFGRIDNLALPANWSD